MARAQVTQQQRAWEDESAARGRRWRALPLLLVGVVAGAYLVRPGGPGLQGLPGLGEPDSLRVLPAPVEEPLPDGAELDTGAAVLHALSTAGLGARVPPVEVPLGGRVLRTAASSRGRQLLALGLEDPATGVAEIQVRHASDLRLIERLTSLDGPLEHLGVSEDGLAVVWARPPRDGQGWRLNRIAIDGPATRIDLPENLQVRDLRGFRDQRIAVVARDLGAPPGSLRVIVYQGLGDPVVDVNVDVGERAPEGVSTEEAEPRAGLAWDDARLLLHIVHAAEDALTTVDLRHGEVITTPPTGEPHLDGVVQREAVLLPQGAQSAASGGLIRQPQVAAVAATGRLIRPAAAADEAPVPLEPLLFEAGYEAAERGVVRGEARAWRALTAGPSNVVFAAPSRRLQTGDRTTRLRVFDRDLGPVWSYQIEGEVTAALINHEQTHLIVVRQSERATHVDELPLGPGEPVHRSFAPGAIVHPTAVVVIEQP